MFQTIMTTISTLNISVTVQNTLCKATVTHSGLHTARVQWVCSEAENSTIATTVKLYHLIKTAIFAVKINTLANL